MYNDTVQGFPEKAKSLAHTVVKRFQENTVTTWPPGMQCRYRSTKQPYLLYGPSTHHVISNSSTQAPQAKGHALSDADSQNRLCGLTSLHSTLNAPRTKRQHENESQSIEQEHGVVKKRLVASAHSANTPISRHSTARQPCYFTLTEPWTPLSQSQLSETLGESAPVPYPFNR